MDKKDAHRREHRKGKRNITPVPLFRSIFLFTFVMGFMITYVITLRTRKCWSRIWSFLSQAPERKECKKYKEIAEILGVSVNTVKTHISLGLKILRKEFPASLLFAFFSLRRLR